MGILSTIASAASSSASQASSSQPRQLPPFVVCPRDGTPNNRFGHYSYYAMGNIPVSEFGICPPCFNATISPTPYGKLFRKSNVEPTTASMCDFSKGWVRTAWIWLYRNYASDARLLATVSSLQATEGTCPNPKKEMVSATRKWFAVRDPETRQTLNQFTICSYCKACVETILPPLKGLFVPAAGGQTCTGTCDLPPYSGRKAQYEVILFHMAQNLDPKTRKPDVSLLVDIIKNYSNLSECRQKAYTRDRHWVNPAMTALTICESCHHEKINMRRGPSSVVGKNFTAGFQANDSSAEFACQLYSPRMMALWDDAITSGNLYPLRDFAKLRAQKLRVFTQSYEVAKAEWTRLSALSNQLGHQGVTQNQAQLSSDFSNRIAGWHVIRSGPSQSSTSFQSAFAVCAEADIYKQQMNQLLDAWEANWE